jgi:hypothetical protein
VPKRPPHHNIAGTDAVRAGPAALASDAGCGVAAFIPMPADTTSLLFRCLRRDHDRRLPSGDLTRSDM